MNSMMALEALAILEKNMEADTSYSKLAINAIIKLTDFRPSHVGQKPGSQKISVVSTPFREPAIDVGIQY